MAENLSFEQGLAALEKLVAEMEQGDLGLEDALKRFEDGVRLASQMQVALEDTGRRIERLGEAAAKGASGDGASADKEASEPESETGARKPRRRKADDPTLF